MSQGNLYIGVYGVNADGVKRTTSLLKYKVAQGALEGVKPTEPTPEIYEQILAKIADVAYPEVPVQSVNGKSGKVILTPEDIGAQPAGNYIIGEADPTVPAWAKQATKPTYKASEVGAEERGAMNTHNTSPDAHNDLRLLIEGLTSRFNAVFDSNDIDLDQMSEIVAYIKDNASLIESVTTSKVNVADIVDNLTTNVKEKPLSAAQGVALKDLIDALQTTVDGKVGARHEHSATEITSGILPVSRGGTGMSTGQNPNAVINLNGESDCFNAIPTKSGALYATTENGTPAFGTLPVAQGGTGATTAEMARASLGVAAATHSHSITELGDLSLATSTADGLMSKEDKRKFDDLDTTLETLSNSVLEAKSDVKDFKEEIKGISSTYETKEAATNKLNEAKAYTDTGVQTAQAYTDTEITNHNVATDAHNDIRLLINSEVSSLSDNLELIGNSALEAKSDVKDLKENLATYETKTDATSKLAEAKGYTDSGVLVAKSYTDEKILNLVGGAPETLNTLDELAAALKDNAGIVDTLNEAIGAKANASDLTNLQAQVNKKANDYTIEIYNGTGGNPKPVRFASFNYSTCNSENGIAAKIGMVSGHGNGTSYAFLQDAIIRVSYVGTVEVDNFKYYGAETGVYDGSNRQYGDIFWLIDATNKIVDFYCLMGQYARVYQTPWKRLTYSTGGTVTQHTSCTVYSSGTKTWANNSDIALMSDIPEIDVEAINNSVLKAKSDVKDLRDDFAPHLSNTSNPHGVTAAQTGALPASGGTLGGSLNFSNSSSWITPYLLAFKNADPNQNPTYPYTGFYQWGNEWQVNARDANNNWARNVMAINLDTAVANFLAVPTVNGNPLMLQSDFSTLSNSVLTAKSDIKDLKEDFATLPNTYETKSDASNKLLEAKAYTNSGVMAANSYTDTKISELINSAPTTLDTLGEIATAMQSNADVVSALNTAIGSKANATHTHSAGDITSGALPLANGGTGTGLSRTSNAIIRFSGSGNYFSQTPTKSGAMYATSDNGAPSFGTLPIAHGGTGATSASAALANLGGMPTSGGTMTGPLKINGAEVDDGSGQLAMLKALSTNTSTTGGGWVGRAVVGARNLTFLMGTYNGLAGIGAHSWSDAASGTGAAWAPMYFNPDGNSPMYFGADGAGWTANRGTLKVQGSTTAGGGEVAVSGRLCVGNSVISDGNLNLKPAAGEGGQILLEASTADRTNNGIALDTANGDFRIFGLESADGTSRPGYGSVLQIDPYDKTILGGYFFDGTAENAVSDGNGNNIASTFKDFREELAALKQSLTITFTISGTSYSAMRGMTWGEWVNSTYNTAGAKIHTDTRILLGAFVSTDYGTGYQCDTDVIAAGKAYVTSA